MAHPGCGEGYEGDFCGECQDRFYYAQGRCLPCRTDEDRTEQVFRAVSIVIFFTIDGMLVTYLGDTGFDRLGSGLVLYQQFVCGLGAASLWFGNGSAARTLYETISMPSFDYAFIRPGTNDKPVLMHHPFPERS